MYIYSTFFPKEIYSQNEMECIGVNISKPNLKSI